MVTRQVITISPAGAVSGLQRKPGQGLDLRAFGRAEINRVSEIEWNDAAQKWQIKLLRVRGVEGAVLTWAMYRLALDLEGVDRGPALFDDYDVAVRFEIAYLDALRRNGHADRLY